MKIELTQDDINRGRPRHICGCPVALAIRRVLGENWVVGINYMVKLRTNKPLKDIYLPAKVVKWIQDFDDNKPVSPITFEVYP